VRRPRRQLSDARQPELGRGPHRPTGAEPPPGRTTHLGPDDQPARPVENPHPAVHTTRSPTPATQPTLSSTPPELPARVRKPSLRLGPVVDMCTLTELKEILVRSGCPGARMSRRSAPSVGAQATVVSAELSHERLRGRRRSRADGGTVMDGSTVPVRTEAQWSRPGTG
jgi:hypothetical protein